MADRLEEMGRSAGRGIASAGVWSVSGKLLSKLIDLATLIILTGILEPADFGLVAKAMMVILVIESVTSVPIEAPILRISNPEKDVYHTAFTLTIIRAGIIFLLVFAFSKPLSIYFQDPRLVPLLIVLAFAPSLRGCLSPRLAEFVRAYNMRPEAVMDIASKCLSLIIATAVALMTKSYWAIVAGSVTTTIALNVLSYWFAPYRPSLTLKRWKEFSDIVTWNTASQFLETMSWQLDQFLLGRFLDTATFGRYSISRTLCDIPVQAIVMPIRRPMVTAFTQAGGTEHRNRIWLNFSNGVLFIVAPLLVILAMLSNTVVFTVLGPGWEDSAIYVSGLSLAIIPHLPAVPLNPYAISIFKTKLVTMRIAVEFAVSVPIITFSVILFGILGAIGAKILIGAAMTVYVFSLVGKYSGLSMRTQFLALWRTAVSLVVLAAMLYLIGENGPALAEQSRIMAALNLVATSLSSLVAYLVLALLLWAVSGKPKTIEFYIWQIIAKGPAIALKKRRAPID